jgi:organic hydroperoxide reductase OsmC/OhrA
MQPLPHVYTVSAAGGASGEVSLTAVGVPRLMSAATAQFDGPGNQWSPESLLAAAIASCFLLTFRAVARASRLTWQQLECEIEATLERAEGVTRFTRVVTRAALTVPECVETHLCEQALTKTEHTCLVANSLNCARELQIRITRVPVTQKTPELEVS